MLTSNSPPYQHRLQNVALIGVSLFFLPFSILVVLASLAFHRTASLSQHGRHLFSRQRPDANVRIILITGVGMTKGLEIARAFHLAGHRVIGADFAPFACGRFSSAIDKFYAVSKPHGEDGPYDYIHELLQIVRRERVHLWVSCSSVASATEDAQAKEIIERGSDCRCIQYDLTTTQILHSKDTFVAHTARIGLPVPETHNITSRAAVHKVLHQSSQTKKRYLLKNVGVDDVSRSEIMTLLPRRTMSQTYNYVAHMPISPRNPWVLQQFIPGKQEYCTHALVIRGVVKAFVACPSSELLMHYEALPPTSAISRAMLRFTQEFVSRSSAANYQGGHAETTNMPLAPMTGHLSFDFLVDEKVTEKGSESILRAIECNPRAHTAVVLFRGREKEMADAYLSLLDGSPSVPSEPQPVTNEVMNGYLDQSALQVPGDGGVNIVDTRDSTAPITPLLDDGKYYWIGNDIITLLLLPLLHLLLLPFFSSALTTRPLYLFYYEYPAAISELVRSVVELTRHILFWKDGTWKLDDPVPELVLYHVYWPLVFVDKLRQGRQGWWSRCNVGTCKVFAC